MRKAMFMKQIPVDALTVGMYVVALDRPWSELAGLTIKHRIDCPEDIAQLKQHGVLRVTIDSSLSLPSPASPPTHSPADFSVSFQPAPPPTGPNKPGVLAVGMLEKELAKARTVRTEAMTAVQSIFEGVKTGVPISNSAVKETVQTLIVQIIHGHDALLCLSHIRQYDTNLFAHAVDVGVFALVVGKYQGFDKVRLEQLGIGALLHDLGYLRLPRNLLRKQGVYSAQERRLMQQHPRLGVAILAQAGDIHPEVQRIVLEHHERIDGSGYPAGLRSLAISPMSEIVGVVDAYEAMLSCREGRPPLLPTQAIKELYKYGMQGHYDRRWVERIIQCLGVYPVGSLVELSTGERGIVTKVNPDDTLKPSVKIIWDALQQPYPTPFIVNLATPEAREPERRILRALDPHQEHVDVATHLTSHPVTLLK